MPNRAWNRTERDYLIDRLVNDLFEDRVRERPYAIAVTCGETDLTYRQLDNRASALAGRLRSAYGVRSGTLVALVQERSERVLISMLAVLKAGGAYVPIAPDNPSRRIELLLRDTQVPVVLTDEAYQARLAEIVSSAGLGARVLAALGEMADDPPSADTVPGHHAVPADGGPPGPDGLAYVIYTSGTSGRPKGVMIEQRSVVNYICNVADRLNLSATDTCAYSTNVSFDLTVTTTLACLAIGGRVAVYQGQVADVDDYRRFLISNGVTFVKLTPSYFGLVADALHETDVRTVVLGGEKLGRAVLQRIRTRPSQDLTVYDEYGPTEATVGTCAAVVYPLPAGQVPNIGRLYRNYQAHVVDSAGRPVPVGEVGELLIGGAGVARGYLGQPELTAERFIDTDLAQRMYRTGDLVRWCASAELEYIGRDDDQVKIRGFRVELGEIEHAVESYGDVDRAVVVATTAGAENDVRGLVAHVVAGEFGCSEDALAAYLGERLPEYLLPSAYVFIDALPLTANGKVDRAALPKPEQGPSAGYVAPRSELERTVTEIWSELLGRGGQPIGVTDEFFGLGGDSIVAIQLLSKLRQRFGVHLPVNELLNRATVERFSEFLAAQLAEQQPGQAGDDEPDALTGEVPLLPIQRWFFLSDFARPGHWNQAFLIATPPLDVERLRLCVRELGNRHGAFRLRYRRGPSGEVTQYYADDYQPADLVAAAVGDDEILQATLTAWQDDFDLRNGPVYRIGYLDGFPDGSARVFIACHHLAVDAVSWRVLAEDLDGIYHDRSLAPADSAYGRWAHTVDRYASEHEGERDYWLQALAEYAQTGDTAMRGLVRSDDTSALAVLTLDTETTARLLRGVHHAYQTQINDVLLAAFAHALTDLTGEPVNHVVLEGHGREDIDPQIDVARTVGWFTTMFPVRLRTSQDPLATLRETKETLRAIPAKGIGYGALYGYRDDELPRINFNYLGQLGHEEDAATGRWRITREPAGQAVHPANRDNNILTINGWVFDGRLTFTIAHMLDRDVGDVLARRFERTLTDLVRELSAARRRYLTASDIDHVISADYLDELQAEREIEGVYLANSLQQGFIYQAVTCGRSDDAYTVQMAWSYATHIDVDALREAWACAQRTFPSLRLRFGWRGELVQIIDATSALDWRLADLADEAEDQQAASLRRLREADRAEPYDLESGPLFRIYLIRRGSAQFHCIFSSHHSILDGWSNTVLLAYVHETYESLIAGLGTDATPDRGYPAGQRYLQEHRHDHDEYWSTHLAAYDERMDLQGLLGQAARADGVRVDRTRRILEMQELAFTVEGDRLAALHRQSRESGVTSNAVLLYVWHKVLACYTGSGQTVTGVVLSGRGIPVNDIDRTVGLFINTLPLVVAHKSDEETVLDAVRSVQRQINELNGRSNVNLADLHEGAGRLFDTLFIYENWPKIGPDSWQSRLAVSMEGEFEKLDYPLSVIVSETPDRIQVRLAFAAELFEPQYMTDMSRMQRHLLDEVLAGWECPWRDARLLTEDWYRELTDRLNPPAERIAPTRTFRDRFVEQARRNPERTAVTCLGTSLTYRALNERANRLAHLLIEAHRVQPEELVVLCLDKGPDLIVGILAVLKAGAAYVLIDPAYPHSRVKYILADAAARIVITSSRYRDHLAELGDAERNPAILALDTQEINEALAAARASDPVTDVPDTALMYVLYTSGTTGAPKGVMIEHRSFDQTIAGVKERYFAGREAVSTCSLTNHVFDIFGLEYGLPLSTAGRVDLASSIPANLDCGDLDFVQMTPSVCDLMLDRLVNARADKTLLLVGGEKLTSELLSRVLTRSLDLVNVYGPTETTIWSTSRLYRHTDPLDGQPVSLGTPFAGESVHVLDDCLRPVPAGSIGELFIGGGGLARGYLNRDDLTAERFVSVVSPVAKGSQPVRLYRTGDLVRLLPSGALEFVGRNDSQVKINGHRIELGEVDVALASHPAVRQSAVVTIDLGISPVLIGYYVSEHEIPADDLSEHLQRSLPAYMLPAKCMRLDAMPLTINGKLDRAALPRPSMAGTRSRVPPRSPVEADLCSLIARVLSRDPLDVGIDDDFFQLGGNSILSIKLISAAERELGISATPAFLLEHRTVREFVDQLDGCSEQWPTIPPASFAQPEEQVLSFAQERIWFIEKFEGGTNAYNLPLVFSVADHADTGILLSAVRAVVGQHDILRTLLKETPDGTGYQVVSNADATSDIEVVRSPDRETMRARMRRDVRRVFDLEHERPLRVCLYDVPNLGRYLAFVIHHVAFDGWSTDVLLEDLTAAYSLLAQAPPGTDRLAGLPAPQLRYRDFAVWQRARLAGELLDQLVRFWEAKLQDYQNLSLVPDKPRPESPDYRGEDIYFDVDVEVSHKLRSLAEELRVSLFSLLLSAQYLTLRCFSNQDDIVVGAPIANRDHPQLSRLIGFFVNTLPLRSRIDERARLVDYVRKTAREVLEVLRHQELPLERLLEILDIERDVSRHPIFQVAFGVQSFGAAPRGAADPADAILRTCAETKELYTVARFDLSTFIDDSREALEINIIYATSLFERPTVDSFAQTYLTILRQFADLAGSESRQRQLTVSGLAYVDGGRYREMVEGWSAPKRRYDPVAVLHQAVEEHARRTPDRTALVWKASRLTYQELNEAANQLAHHLLRRRKREPDAIVMLCLDRGDDIVISILATLKAGACYLPADPTYPDDRIAFMLADAGVRTVLTHRRYAERFADMDGIDVIAVDEPSTQVLIDAELGTDPVTAVAPGDLAYVLYTSGTTGRPKGVPQTHGNVVRLFAALERVYDLRGDDVWTLFHNYVFDFTVWEMWGALRYGGRLVVPTFEETRDPNLFYALCRRERVTMLCQTPTAFYQFVNVALGKDERQRVDDLRYVFFGGEPLNVSLLKEWFARYSYDRPRLAMGYGTTETTVFTCYKLYDEADEGSTDIGRLIPDVAGYVLDAQLRPLPIGAVGQLHIGGAGLAPGFLNLPELTVQKFITNPFHSAEDDRNGEPGWNARLYKSGDLVRWAPDGSLRFVGRNDLQVKVRGHRIELGEIETILSSAPGVAQCAVVLRQTGDASGQNHLVGYYVADAAAGSTVDAEALLEHLCVKLPEYMIPAALVAVPEIPRKISGKLDVNALPAPQLSRTREAVAPRNQAEAQARRVMADVLGADPEVIGVHDDFFRLGGNSILSIKLVSRLSAELRADISIAAIFRYRSIARLVDSLGSTRAAPTRIPCRHPRAEADQVLSFAQERLWFVDRYERGTDAYNIHLCYEVDQGVDVDLLESCFRAIYERHEALRTVMRQSTGGEFFQAVLDHRESPLSVRHVAVTSAEDLAAKVRVEAGRHFDLAGEAPFRITFYHDDESARTRAFVGILIHHIAFDGWSADLLLHELDRFYQYFSRPGSEATLDLPELTIQYRDYAAWEREHISGDRLGALLGYWLPRLDGRKPLELPADRPRPHAIDYRGSQLVFELDRDTSLGLRRLASLTGAGLFSVLLSAYYLLLQAYTNRNDVLVGVPVFNRAQGQTHDLIGCFINSLALDFDIDRNDDVETLIRKVGARVVEAQEYQELPFERLVAELDLPVDPSRHPLFQLWFDVNSFAETESDRAAVSGLARQALLKTHVLDGYTPDGESATTSKFDLGVVINDGNESLAGTFIYAASLYEPSTVERFAATYRSILEQFARVV